MLKEYTTDFHQMFNHISNTLKRVLAWDIDIKMEVRKNVEMFSDNLVVQITYNSERYLYTIEDYAYEYNLKHNSDVTRLISYLKNHIENDMPEIFL
jgi:hypothetical protein